jgi:GMP synthase-like glutamine amidotransferase
VRVLAIVHDADAGPGVFVEAVAARGDQLDAWDLARGKPAPGDPLGYDAVIALGGAAHPDQEAAHPWLAAEKALLAELLARDTPLLGVCLGAQLLAEAAGARARAAPRPEVGWYRVKVGRSGAEDPLLAPLAPEFEALEWHSYECSLPAGAVELARSERCLQAFRAGTRAWGIQFHAEVTLTDFDAWLDEKRTPEEAARLGFDPVDLRARTRSGINRWNQLGRELCGRFLEQAGATA